MRDFLEHVRGGDVVVDFVERIAGIDVDGERDEVLSRLEGAHLIRLAALGFQKEDFATAEQVHGCEVAVVRGGGKVAGVDGLVTDERGVCLGIYVADCGLIYLRDTKTGAVGLLHSGKKGTELGILPKALHVMAEGYGTQPEDVLVSLGPCIRPPAYEVDFAAEIRCQALAAGIREEAYFDCGVCTSTDVATYYSYRTELGKTGRLLGLMGRK